MPLTSLNAADWLYFTVRNLGEDVSIWFALQQFATAMIIVGTSDDTAQLTHRRRAEHLNRSRITLKEDKT